MYKSYIFLFFIILLACVGFSNATPTTKQLDLQQQLQASELQLSTVSQQVTAISHKILDEKAKLNRLHQTQQPLLNQLNTQQQTLAQQVRLMYQLKQTQSIANFFNPDDLNTANRHLMYYQALSDARARLVADIKNNIAIIHANTKVINEHEAAVSHLVNERHKHQNEQHQIKHQRQQIVSQLGYATISVQQKIAATLVSQKTLQNTLRTLPKQPSITPKTTFTHSHVHLRWPSTGTIIASYGAWINNQRLPGVIIKAPEGTPVHAIDGGKVIFANWLRGFGLLIIISHSNGYMSLYGRNRTLYAKVGDVVQPRTVIATLGNSGGFNKPSLYFEIRQNGKPINPNTWCR